MGAGEDSGGRHLDELVAGGVVHVRAGGAQGVEDAQRERAIAATELHDAAAAAAAAGAARVVLEDVLRERPRTGREDVRTGQGAL